MLPRLDRLLTGLPAQKIILGFADTKYKRSTSFQARFIFIRAASVAAMQERTSNPARFVAVADGDSDFRRTILQKFAREQAQNAPSEPPLTVSIVLRDAV
jgi:hypothetical protein